MSSVQFDLNDLASSVDRKRLERGLSWAALAHEVGVATSTIRRFAVAADAEADGVLALIGWLGVSPEDFVAQSVVTGSPLPERGNGVIRVDMERVVAIAGMRRSSRPRTRTTIQRLVAVAQASGVTVASLTRWSQL